MVLVSLVMLLCLLYLRKSCCKACKIFKCLLITTLLSASTLWLLVGFGNFYNWCYFLFIFLSIFFLKIFLMSESFYNVKFSVFTTYLKKQSKDLWDIQSAIVVIWQHTKNFSLDFSLKSYLFIYGFHVFIRIFSFWGFKSSFWRNALPFCKTWNAIAQCVSCESNEPRTCK